MFANLNGWHALIVVVVILLLFGAPKIPALASEPGPVHADPQDRDPRRGRRLREGLQRCQQPPVRDADVAA